MSAQLLVGKGQLHQLQFPLVNVMVSIYASSSQQWRLNMTEWMNEWLIVFLQLGRGCLGRADELFADVFSNAHNVCTLVNRNNNMTKWQLFFIVKYKRKRGVWKFKCKTIFTYHGPAAAGRQHHVDNQPYAVHFPLRVDCCNALQLCV